MGIVPALEPYVTSYAVATAEEALTLRRRTDKPITVLCCGAYKRVRGTAFSVGSLDDAFAIPSGVKAAVKIDSGMHRTGCDEQTLPAVLRTLSGRHIEIDSAYTHFCDPSDAETTARQFERFDGMTRTLGVPRHCCASNCLTLDKTYYLDGVRPGLALYGYGRADLRPAMTVTAPVIAVRFVRKGEHIGYGDYTARRDMRVATVRLGYADGFRRCGAPLSVDCKGQKCRVVGRVCMDMFMFDASLVAVRPGETVTVLGGRATMDALCRAYRTIEYEVLTGFDKSRSNTIYIGL